MSHIAANELKFCSTILIKPGMQVSLLHISSLSFYPMSLSVFSQLLVYQMLLLMHACLGTNIHPLPWIHWKKPYPCWVITARLVWTICWFTKVFCPNLSKWRSDTQTLVWTNSPRIFEDWTEFYLGFTVSACTKISVINFRRFDQLFS